MNVATIGRKGSGTESPPAEIGARHLTPDTRVGLVIAAVLFSGMSAGCGGGPPIDRKDTVTWAKVIVRYREGVVDALGLPEAFRPLEAERKEVAYTIADRGTCTRIRNRLADVKPRRGHTATGEPPLGTVTIKTGWGRTINATWYGSHFEMPDGRSFDSSQLSDLLASHIKATTP